MNNRDKVEPKPAEEADPVGAGGSGKPSEPEQTLRLSQSTIKALLEAAHEAIYVVDAGGVVLAANEIGVMRFDLTPEETIGRNAFDLLPPEIAESRRNRFEEVVSFGEPVRFTDERRGRILDNTLYPIKDEQGRVLLIAVYTDDVTERIMAEQALRDSQRLLDKAQDLARLGNWTWDIASHEVSYSQSFHRLLEVNPGDLGPTYEGLLSLIHPDDRARVRQALTETVAEGKTFDREFHLVRPYGGEIVVQGLAELVYNELDEPVRVLGTVQDITRRRMAEDLLRESQARVQAIVETAAEGIVTIDDQGLITSFNRAAESIFGYKSEEVLGKNLTLLMPSPDREQHPGYLEKYLSTAEKRITGPGREVEGRRKDGTDFPLELSVSEVVINNRRVFTGLLRDITERKRVERELRIKESAIQSSLNSIVMTDLMGNINYVNRAALKNWGFDREDQVLGHPAGRFLKDWQQGQAALEALLKSGEWFGELEAVRGNGESFYIQVSTSLVKDQHGEPICAMFSSVDITERKRAEEQLRRQAIYDALTGLYNRSHFMELLENAVSAARRHNMALTAVMADIDYFKAVNDTYGHRAGDDVLAGFGRLIMSALRAEDLAGRYGGEEFVMVLPHTTAPAGLAVVERLRKKLAQIVFKAKGNLEFSVTSSFGLAELVANLTEAQLLERADQALYQAKRSGRNRAVLYGG
ncbi:MAG: PAS domain S-box protein [Thermodesulfobacteriota bacterium]